MLDEPAPDQTGFGARDAGGQGGERALETAGPLARAARHRRARDAAGLTRAQRGGLRRPANQSAAPAKSSSLVPGRWAGRSSSARG